MKRWTATLAVLGLIGISTTALAQKLTVKDARSAYAALIKQGKNPRLADGKKPRYVTYKVKNKEGKLEPVKVWIGGPALISPVPIPGPDPKPTPVRMAVKVWAELSDSRGTHTGRLVNIQRYKWQKNERFYFWFESAVPVQMSLTQYYDVGPSEAKKPRLVSPNRYFPKTYATVPAGEPTYFPQLFKTDDTLADEFAMLTLVAAGATIIDEGKVVRCPINQDILEDGGSGSVLKDTEEFFITLTPKRVPFKKSPKKKLSPRLLQAVDPQGIPSPVTPENPTRVTSERPDVVALFVLGSETIGHLPLRFWKK